MIIVDEKKIKEINEAINEMIYFDEFNDGFNLLEDLKKYSLTESFSTLDKKLQDSLFVLVAKLQWLCLPMLRAKDVLFLFENYLDLALLIEDFDLWKKFKIFLFSFELHKDRDGFKQEVKRVLEKNNRIITSLKLEGDRNPTVENWLKKYISFVGLVKTDSIKMQQFLNGDKDIKRLNSNEKIAIEKLLQFYEKLKISSLTVAGVEETIPISTDQFKGYIRNGKIEREAYLTPEQKRILNIISGQDQNSQFFELESEKDKYEQDSLERKTIDENLDKKGKLDELRKIADSYKPGSLPRKAVEEEIRKLETK